MAFGPEKRCRLSLETALYTVTIVDLFSRKRNVSKAVAILERLYDAPSSRTGCYGEGVVNSYSRLGQRMALVAADSPGIVFDESNMVWTDATRSRGKRPGPNVNGCASRVVDSPSDPGCVLNVFDHNVIHNVVRIVEVDCTADAGTTIRARKAVFVLRRGVVLGGGKEGVDDASVRVAGSILDPTIAYFSDAFETEFLRKVIARLVRRTVHFKGERDISETAWRVAGECPEVADQSRRCLGGS